MGLFGRRTRAARSKSGSTLIPGQTFDTSCPYLWGFCSGGSCDGCLADAEQANGSPGPPWVQGTTAYERHQMVRDASEGRGEFTMTDLVDGGGFRRN